MDRKLQILLGAGIIITIISLLVSIYLAGVVFIILVAIVMSMLIMQDTTFLPDIMAEFSDDAKSVVIRNSGNAVAMKIHVAIVPTNIEFDLHSLAVEATYLHPLGQMCEEVKVAVSFENEKGTTFSRTYRLSSLGGGFEPLKPMIPIFGWK
ncbi:MAG: hypothetical protein M0Q92_05560 [Methanoregula sp.]|jgi:hypothetical protein|nr:hypothetical protein [Methanoregula sp.]